MRSFLRLAMAVTALAAIVCFCSCERHHPDELPAEGDHAGASAGNQVDTAHAESSPSATPADFFPSATPH